MNKQLQNTHLNSVCWALSQSALSAFLVHAQLFHFQGWPKVKLFVVGFTNAILCCLVPVTAAICDGVRFFTMALKKPYTKE